MKSILIILVILAILSVLFFIPITVEYALSYDGNIKSSFVLRFLFFQKKLTDKLNKRKNKEKKPKEKKSISQIIEDVKYYKRLFKYFKKDISLILGYAKEKTVRIKNISFDVGFAGKDAMQTGIYTGVVNGGVYNTLAILENSVGVEDWSVNVEPDFHANAFVNAKIHCILNTKPAHIIVILIKILVIYLKYRRNREKI